MANTPAIRTSTSFLLTAESPLPEETAKRYFAATVNDIFVTIAAILLLGARALGRFDPARLYRSDLSLRLGL